MTRVTIEEEGWFQRGIRWATLVGAFMLIAAIGATLGEVLLIAGLLAVNRFFEDRLTKIEMVQDLGRRIQAKLDEKRRRRRDDPKE